MKVHLPQPSNPERESRKFGSMMESDRKLPLLRVRDVYFDLRHPLNGGDFISLIGNQCSSCRIRLEDDSTVSNAHLEVRYTTQPRPSVWVIDLNSGNYNYENFDFFLFFSLLILYIFQAMGLGFRDSVLKPGLISNFGRAIG